MTGNGPEEEADVVNELVNAELAHLNLSHA
jgi:hypothetical protein